MGVAVSNAGFFDTVLLETGAHTQAVVAAAQASSINLRRVDATHVAVSLDETVTVNDLGKLIQVFADALRSEEHKSELQSLMRISYAVFCLKKQQPTSTNNNNTNTH